MKICKCHNCGAYLKDENPQVDAPEWPDDVLVNVQEMIFSDWENAHLCPNCLTDSYLLDTTEEERDETLIATGQKTRTRIKITF